MSNKIYFKHFDEPKKWEHTFAGKTYKGVNIGEFVCDNPNVEWFKMFGYSNSNPKDHVGMNAQMLFKNGNRWTSKNYDEPDAETEQKLIDEAVSYLDNGGIGDAPLQLK